MLVMSAFEKGEAYTENMRYGMCLGEGGTSGKWGFCRYVLSRRIDERIDHMIPFLAMQRFVFLSLPSRPFVLMAPLPFLYLALSKRVTELKMTRFESMSPLLLY